MSSALLRLASEQLISLRTFLPACSSALGGRGFAAASGDRPAPSTGAPSSPDSDADAPGIDPKYRSPTEMVWPASRHQERFAARLQNALTSALLKNDGLRDALVQRLGFAIKDVRMSPDNLKAFIQWDSFTGQAPQLERELRRLGPKVRGEVARVLRARNVPQLVFRHDGLTPRQQEVEDVFRQLEEAEAAEAEAMAGSWEDPWGGSEDDEETSEALPPAPAR